MKTKIKKCTATACLAFCVVFSSGAGSAFMNAPMEASAGTGAETREAAEEIEAYASPEDVTETIEASAFSEGATYESAEGVLYEYSSSYGGFVATGAAEGCVAAYIPDTLTVSVSGTSHTYDVVRVGEEAFSGNCDITYVRIGRHVGYIGHKAFCKTQYVERVEYLAKSAENGGKDETGSSSTFYYLGKSASSVEIFVGRHVEIIPEGMFRKSYVTSITFEEGSCLKEIGACAFYDIQSAVSDIRLPDTVEVIGDEAFYSGKAVDSINVPESVRTLGYRAYRLECLDILHYDAVSCDDMDEDTQPFYGLSKSYWDTSKAKFSSSDHQGVTVYIGRNVEKIPAYCFYSTCTIKNADAGTLVTNVYPAYFEEAGSDDGGYALSCIGTHAFSKCLLSFGEVVLPSGVETIEPYAFSESSVESLTLGDTDGWYVTDSDGVKAGDAVQYWFGQEYMSDPEIVARYLLDEYSEYRFCFSDGFEYELSSDGMSYVVTAYVGGGGDVTFPETHRAKPVTDVGADAFKNDASVTSIIVPESTERIGERAFLGCTALSAVSIRGSGLKEVGSDAFFGCTALKSLYVSSASAFVSVDYGDADANPLSLVSFNGGKFYVGGDSYTTLTINDTDRIGTYALAECNIISDIVIGESVKTISSYAFYGNTAIKSITIPSSVTQMGAYAFGATALSMVTFEGASGWSASSGSVTVKFSASDLSANSVEYLTSAYASYEWARTETYRSAPTVESKTENGGYTNSAISITTTVDGASSIWYIAYTDPDGNEYKVYDHSLTLSEGLANGTYVFVSVDADGLESEPYYINFDDVAPDLYVGGAAAWVNYSSTEFSVIALDESPVGMYSSRDGTVWTACGANPYTVYPTGTYDTDGEYWFVAVDAAGNVTGPYYTVLDTLPVTGEWETGDDLYPYFSYEAPSYTTWTCTMNGEPYASGTKVKTCMVTYYVTLVGKNGSSLSSDYTLEHLYTESGVYTAPTCSSYGYTTYSCVFCGDSYIVPDLDSTTGTHNYEERRIEPTCTEKGAYWYVCTECGDSTTPVEIDALGHDPVADQMAAATCTEAGYTGKICSRCGVLLEGETIPATGHSYLTVSYPATCAELAKTVYTCSVCGDAFEVTTGMYYADHVWGDWEHVSPTCTEEGYETRRCGVCGETEEYVLKATGHSYTSAVWHEWTDEETGKIYRYRFCDVCGADGAEWYDADDPTRVASNGVIDLFEKYQKYMWWILLAFVAVWSIIIGLRWALARNGEEKAKSHSMLANYIIGLFVIAIILVGLPYFVYGVALLVG